jgi:hypothetical protein
MTGVDERRGWSMKRRVFDGEFEGRGVSTLSKFLRRLDALDGLADRLHFGKTEC